MTLVLLAALALAQETEDDAEAIEEANRARVEGRAAEENERPPWEVVPYLEPLSRLQGFVIQPLEGGPVRTITVQTVIGGNAGLRYRFLDSHPNLYGFSRISGNLTLSLTHSTIGLEGRLGSFFGVDDRYYRVWTGPDFFYNLYGPPISAGRDYVLEPSPGLAWDTRVILKPADAIWLFAGMTPSFLHNPRRRASGVFDEITLNAGFTYSGPFSFSVSYVYWRHATAQMQGVMVTTR